MIVQGGVAVGLVAARIPPGYRWSSVDKLVVVHASKHNALANVIHALGYSHSGPDEYRWYSKCHKVAAFALKVFLTMICTLRL